MMSLNVDEAKLKYLYVYSTVYGVLCYAELYFSQFISVTDGLHNYRPCFPYSMYCTVHYVLVCKILTDFLLCFLRMHSMLIEI